MESNEYPTEMQRLVDRIAPAWPPVLDVSPGWYPLLAQLDTRLSAIAPGYVLQQCKSKFGSLSFYASPSDDPSECNEEFNETIRAAECSADSAAVSIDRSAKSGAAKPSAYISTNRRFSRSLVRRAPRSPRRACGRWN